jgi:ferredoxin
VCIGAGVCVVTAPTLFDQDPDSGLVRLRVDVVADDAIGLMREAVDHCPSGALSIADDEERT